MITKIDRGTQGQKRTGARIERREDSSKLIKRTGGIRHFEDSIALFSCQIQ